MRICNCSKLRPCDTAAKCPFPISFEMQSIFHLERCSTVYFRRVPRTALEDALDDGA